MVEMKIKTSQIPSERTAQGQRDECRQQEVSDSVEVKGREGHHGNGQGQREAGGQRQEFAERDQEKVGWTPRCRMTNHLGKMCVGDGELLPVAEL